MSECVQCSSGLDMRLGDSTKTKSYVRQFNYPKNHGRVHDMMHFTSTIQLVWVFCVTHFHVVSHAADTRNTGQTILHTVGHCLEQTTSTSNTGILLHTTQSIGYVGHISVGFDLLDVLVFLACPIATFHFVRIDHRDRDIDDDWRFHMPHMWKANRIQCRSNEQKKIHT